MSGRHSEVGMESWGHISVVFDFAYNHFSKTEIDYLMEEIDLMEAASISGINCDAFRKRIDRRKADFRKAMRAIDMI